MALVSREKARLAAVLIVVVSAIPSATWLIRAQTASLPDLMQQLKDVYQLKDLREAKLTQRASGVIKNEDPKTKTLLLLIDNVCDEKGASAVVFSDPYCKTRLLEPAVCDGKRIDRYRVDQGYSVDPNAVCSSYRGH